MGKQSERYESAYDEYHGRLNAMNRIVTEKLKKLAKANPDAIISHKVLNSLTAGELILPISNQLLLKVPFKTKIQYMKKIEKHIEQLKNI